MSKEYAEMRKAYMGFDRKVDAAKEAEINKERRPFVTGCLPCSGDHNKTYKRENYMKGMERALNFADNK
ncbi:hypothetical protein KI387_043798, partial [Taxus chinensis]